MSSSSSSWTDEQIEVVIVTTIVVTFVSIVAYYIIFKHQGPQQRPTNDVANNAATNNVHTNYPRQAASAAAAATGTGRPRNRNGGNGGIDDHVNVVRTRTNVNNPINGNTNNNNNNNGDNNDDGDAEEDDGVLSLLAANTRQPPHFSMPPSSSSSSSTIPIMSISKLHHEGVIPFRYTLASSYETRRAAKQKQKQKQKSTNTASAAAGMGSKIQPSAQQLANRKDRAKLFTKLFASTLSLSSSSPSSSSSTGDGLAPPPSRGSNIIVSIPCHDVAMKLKCSKLRRVLFLLGTYYNLFVLLSIDDDSGTTISNAVKDDCNDNCDDDVTMNDYAKDKKRLDDLIIQLRGCETNGDGDDFLSEQILPSHRILTTSSVSSRVVSIHYAFNAHDHVTQKNIESLKM